MKLRVKLAALRLKYAMAMGQTQKEVSGSVKEDIVLQRPSTTMSNESEPEVQIVLSTEDLNAGISLGLDLPSQAFPKPQYVLDFRGMDTQTMEMEEISGGRSSRIDTFHLKSRSPGGSCIGCQDEGRSRASGKRRRHKRTRSEEEEDPNTQPPDKYLGMDASNSMATIQEGTTFV